jgi:hypothetical protein
VPSSGNNGKHTRDAKRSSDFVETGLNGRTDFIFVRYSAINSGVANSSRYCFKVTWLKSTVLSYIQQTTNPRTNPFALQPTTTGRRWVSQLRDQCAISVMQITPFRNLQSRRSVTQCWMNYSAFCLSQRDNWRIQNFSKIAWPSSPRHQF